MAEHARQLEQLQRFFQRDRVQALAGLQRGELRLVLVVLGADLRERSEAAEAHRNRLAGRRIVAEHAVLLGLVEAHRFHLVGDLGLERSPELAQQRHPFFFAA
jgi:hypothetical protein